MSGKLIEYRLFNITKSLKPNMFASAGQHN